MYHYIKPTNIKYHRSIMFDMHAWYRKCVMPTWQKIVGLKRNWKTNTKQETKQNKKYGIRTYWAKIFTYVIFLLTKLSVNLNKYYILYLMFVELCFLFFWLGFKFIGEHCYWQYPPKFLKDLRSGSEKKSHHYLSRTSDRIHPMKF